MTSILDTLQEMAQQSRNDGRYTDAWLKRHPKEHGWVVAYLRQAWTAQGYRALAERYLPTEAS